MEVGLTRLQRGAGRELGESWTSWRTISNGADGRRLLGPLLLEFPSRRKKGRVGQSRTVSKVREKKKHLSSEGRARKSLPRRKNLIRNIKRQQVMQRQDPKKTKLVSVGRERSPKDQALGNSPAGSPISHGRGGGGELVSLP